jgi:hypothetical protein
VFRRHTRSPFLTPFRTYRYIAPTLTFTTKQKQTPFVIYDESFSDLLGQRPTVDAIITDPREPFFYSGGAWIARQSTLFLTSNLIRDHDPAAVSSANRRTEITRLEIRDDGHVVRDKVRCPERSYMAAGCAVHPHSESPAIVFCAQGSLKEPAALISVEAKRPHAIRVLLNNFHGRPLNSPCEIVTNLADSSLFFTDPAYGFERRFRPKPQLPTGHIYRFDPVSGDCRVLATGISRPAGLAFSPDYSVLYVSELGDKYGGTYIYAYDTQFSHASRVAPSFNTSVAPGAPNRPSGNHSASSSTDSSDGSGRDRVVKLTPNSSPQRPTPPSNVLDRKAISRSDSRSGSRSQEATHNRLLSSLSVDMRSAGRAPTSNPAAHVPATAFSTSSSHPRGTFLTNKRLFAYSPNTAPSGGISTDPVQGNVWLGTEEGVEVWSASGGELIGKILVDEWEDPPKGISNGGVKSKMKGVSKVTFTSQGQALLLGGERVWRLTYGRHGETPSV